VKNKTDEQRFFEAVDKQPGGCWNWTGARTAGYGVIRIGGKQWRAHRWLFERINGPIPDGLVLDHLCRNPACVNPAHLEPVTDRVNLLRGVGPSAKNAQKTHCPKGHAYTPENTYLNKRGQRYCVACHRDRERERRATLTTAQREHIRASANERARRQLSNTTPDRQEKRREVWRKSARKNRSTPAQRAAYNAYMRAYRAARKKE